MRNPWAGLRGLPTDVWIIFATSLVNRAGMMALPFLVLYLTKDLAISASAAGLALSVYGLGSLITSPIGGRLCDRVGPFAVLRGSLVLTGIVVLVIPVVHSFAAIVVLTFVWALVNDAGRPATLSAIVAVAGPEQRKAAIALNRLAVNIGMSIGPTVGGFLALLSFKLLFVVDGATSLGAAVVLTALLRARRVSTRPASTTPTPGETSVRTLRRANILADSAAMVFCAGMFLTMLVFFQTQGAYALYIVRDLHYRESFLGALFTINTVAIVALEVPLNLAMAHWSNRRAMMLGAFLVAVGFGATAGAHTALPLAMTVVVWTFGEMILFPSSTSYLASLAPSGRTGAYMGAYAATTGCAYIVGPWLGTAAIDRLGAGAVWAGSLLCGLGATVAFSRAREGRAVSLVPDEVAPA
jgi:predicted MFS family arabinose efflux permease